ncbi:hypothetical protein JL720_13642 [Aureococcus anophagefferens]|nr:hypothetical protein JL720_13642 [Aureococcus anophagefferens]
MATRRPCGVCGNTYAENKDGALRKHKCVDALIDVPAVPAAAPDAAARTPGRARRSPRTALVEFDGCRLVARGEGFDDIVPQPLLAVQRGAGAVLRRTVVYCGPRTASAAVHVAHADAGPVFLANSDLRCDAGLADALGSACSCACARSRRRGPTRRGAPPPRPRRGRAPDRAALEDCPKVVGVATSLIRGADRGVHADREAPAAFRRDVALEGGTVVLACSPSAGTSVFRRVPKDVLALVASYVAADRILDMVPNLRTQAKRRYEATADARVPGAADELANDLELRKRYGGLRAGVQHRDATDYGVDDDVAADDYAVTVPAPPSYARRCADHGKRFARSSSAAMTLGVCTQGADPNESRVALCVAGRLRKAVTLVYNPRANTSSRASARPPPRPGRGLLSGGPCPTCRRATSVVVDEAQVSAAIWACLPARFRDWAERAASACPSATAATSGRPRAARGLRGGYGD